MDKINNQILLFFLAITFICNIAQGQNEVRIGKYVVSTNDLNVTRFNNGDEIPVYKNSEEAKKYVKEGKPACIKVGNSVWYNWYAVNDKRGITQDGWYIPNSREFTDFMYTCSEQSVLINNQKKSILPGVPTGTENQEPYFRWWIGGEIKGFADPIVEILKSESSFGPLSTKAVKKTDFYPVRLFDIDPVNNSAQIYFTKQTAFKVKNDTIDWNIVIESENCTWGTDENFCLDKAKISLQSKQDESKNYIIEVNDFTFSINKKDEIISDLGLRFNDFNFDGKNDFGFGFDSDMYDGLLPKVYLMAKDGQRFVDNKEFNKLIQGPFEISTFDLAQRKFQQISTYYDGYEFVEYYLCNEDSLEKFSDYKLPKELEEYWVNYPNVFLIEYFSMNGKVIEKFKWNDDINKFTKLELNDIEYNEYTKQPSYSFQFENEEQIQSFKKIDSTQFYKLYKNVTKNPFIFGKTFNEKLKLKEFSSNVSRKGKKLQIIFVEQKKELIFEDDKDDQGNFYIFRGETENKESYIITFGGEYCGSNEFLVNKENGRIDTIPRYPRYSPDGAFIATGNFELDETGEWGFVDLYKVNNSGIEMIKSIPLGEFEYSFAPYDLFWIDNRSIAINQIKKNALGEYYFEYAILTFDLSNY
jgi:hypothetical protein